MIDLTSQSQYPTNLVLLWYWCSVTHWVAFVSVGVGEGASQRIPLSALARDLLKGLAREIFPVTRRGRGKEGSRENRRRQNRDVDWTGQSTEVEGSRQLREERRLLGPVDSVAGLANVRGWVSIPGNFVGISLELTLALAHGFTECQESVKNFALLTLGAEPSPYLFVFLFFHPLGCVCCVLCVRKGIWNTPSRRWEKPLGDLMAMSGLGGWDSGCWSQK